MFIFIYIDRVEGKRRKTMLNLMDKKKQYSFVKVNFV